MTSWLQPKAPLNRPKRIALLGGTGSIGQSTLSVIRHARQWAPDANPRDDVGGAGQEGANRFCLHAISGHSQVKNLSAAAEEFCPARVVVSDRQAALDWPHFAPNFAGRFQSGEDALCDVASDPEVDLVVAAIVGSAGLPSTLAALEAGKVVALANKETMVVAGHLAVAAAVEHDARLLPVDSEHSAIFQAMRAGRGSEIRRVILTASGGPFREVSSADLQEVTPAQALAHPTWNMGSKISIDSATMINKALEVIEAKWLFDLPPEKIEIVVHRQSIVHSLVEFCDGSILAQLSPPDMRVPIQYALDFPHRCPGAGAALDFSLPFCFDFQPPDMDRFPALLLGLEVARRGGTCGVVLNAANEIVVNAFLAGQIRFPQIASICRQVLDHHSFDALPSLEQLHRLDQWARLETRKCIGN